MMNELTEDDFKRKIQQREKAENKKRDVREVLVTYTTVATDVFQKYMNERTIAFPKEEFFLELRNLRDYVKGLLDELRLAWKTQVPSFSNNPNSEFILGEYIY